MFCRKKQNNQKQNQRLNQLRWHLTLMNTLVLLGLSVFIAVTFYVSSQISRDNEINNNLEAYCAQLSGDMTDTEGHDWRSLLSLRSDYEDFQEALQKSSIAYAVWDETLTPVSVTENLGLSTDQLKTLIQRYFADGHRKYWITNYKTDEQDIRICTYITVSDQGALRAVQVLRDLSEFHYNLSSSVGIIFAVVILCTTASVLCGYFLSGRALIPIKNNMIRQQEFMADASHELRTPIAVIKTNLEVVASNPASTVASQQEWLKNAGNETQRMQRIVADMMFLARADAGELEEHLEIVDMDFLCSEVTERMLTIAMKKNITLISDAAGSELPVLGDRGQLTQLLVILLDNAIKYSDTDTFVRIRPVLEDHQAVISVKDQGVGIAEEECEKIFERFYRVDKVRSRAEGGTGLGLPIAKLIVEKHGGSIAVLSRHQDLKAYAQDTADEPAPEAMTIGRNKTGSTFIVKLPIIMEKDEINA